MKRGFKAQAERTAISVRQELGLGEMDALCPWKYAKHLGIEMLDFDKLGLSEANQNQLITKDPKSWSGMTLRLGEVTGIVLNPKHSIARQKSTLMHELAHFSLKHVPARVEVSASKLMLLSDYSDEQETEADWLGFTMLLPRELLYQLRKDGKSAKQIAKELQISEDVCTYRLRMTGVDIQLKNAARKST